MSDRLLTYPELAEFLGRSEEAARQLAKRRRWRRVISNEDGRARVSVPADFLEAPRPPVDRGTTGHNDDRSAGEQPGDDQAVDRSDALTVVTLLREQVERLEEDLDRTRTGLDEARAALEAERIRAAQVEVLRSLLESERLRAEELREADRQRLEDLKAERDRWAAQAERLVMPAPPERRGLFGWLRRA